MNSIFILNFLFNVFSNPVELGDVSWNRNYDKALALSKLTHKPVLILFQEIPGCSTCQRFGNEVLKDKIVVELIEDNFVPLAIYNNKEGEDKKVLDKYKEPSWNNPVIRIVDENGKDLLPRHNGQYSKGSVVSYIRQALFKSGKLIPAYLTLIEDEYNAIQTDELTFEMYCFWSGEKNIGAIDGVILTEPGYVGGKEVVRLKYDKSKVSPKKILDVARKAQCADAIYTQNQEISNDAKSNQVDVKKPSTFRLDKDVHYYLKHSKYKNLPLTPMQATKVNSLIGQGVSPEHLITPRQLKML